MNCGVSGVDETPGPPLRRKAKSCTFEEVTSTSMIRVQPDAGVARRARERHLIRACGARARNTWSAAPTMTPAGLAVVCRVPYDFALRLGPVSKEVFMVHPLRGAQQ